MDLKVLYRQVIMDHYKNPKNKGLKKADPYHLVHLTNPSCGDDMSVEIIVENDQVVDVRQDGKGCSICLSSASVMSDLLIGKSVEEAKNIINNFYEMVKGNDDLDEDELGEAIADGSKSETTNGNEADDEVHDIYLEEIERKNG